MGRSFGDNPKPNNQMESLETYLPIFTPSAAAVTTTNVRFRSRVDSCSDTDSPNSDTQTGPAADSEAQSILHNTWVEISSDDSTQSTQPKACVGDVLRMDASRYTPTPWALTDPLFKDLPHLSRLYLSHYQQIVDEFVVYSQSKNPWREIIPLVGSSPLMAYILSAMGALHYSLLSSSDSSRLPWSSQNLAVLTSFIPPGEIESMVTPSNTRRPSSRAYHHFLEFKQRTLYQLSHDLCNPRLRKDDRTLAAIFVLAFLDLLESGSGAWRFPIEGAKKLLRSRPQNELGRSMLQGLEAFAIDGCLIMEIMGSTLARPGVLSKPFYSSTMGPAMLKRLEVNSWVGCPAYLLEAIFYVHTLWFPDSEIAAVVPQPAILSRFPRPGQPLTFESYAALLWGIQNFDATAWAQEMQSSFFLSDLTSRITLARVYQASVYLYVSRVLSRTREGYAPPWTDIGVPPDHSLVASELINRICSIPLSDPHFKCLIWPTFIAGAECRRTYQRTLILEKLGALYKAVTSVNVCNAAWVLRLMWQKQGLKQRECNQNQRPSRDGADSDDFDGSFDWIDELDESRLDWLFI